MNRDSSVPQLSAVESASEASGTFPQPRPPVSRFVPRSARAARAVSMVALLLTLAGVAQVGRAAYYLCTDSFVAPLILSSDSELVLPSKLNLARLESERMALLARIEQGKLMAHATEVTSAKLADLKESFSRAVGWVKDVNEESVRVGARGLGKLDKQRRLLRARIAEQKDHLKELEVQLLAGLVRKEDLLREVDALKQLEVAALQYERDRLGSSSELRVQLRAQRALSAVGNSEQLGVPEVLRHREQLVRIEVELLKSKAERTSREAELRLAGAELTKLDALIAEVKARPIFRAIASQQHVAFVPYTQLEGIATGADVHACRLWSLFFCRRVGSVSVLLPGEVATQDPWGAIARGQYALLELAEPEAARSKMLRVRGGSSNYGSTAHAAAGTR